VVSDITSPLALKEYMDAFGSALDIFARKYRVASLS